MFLLYIQTLANTCVQVRIVQNTHADKDATGKKKNRGYAFIEFERPKDMTGNYFPP
jgi:hypothetical protein